MKKNNLQKYCMVFCLTVFFHLGYINSAPIAENTKDTKPVAWWNFNSCNSGIITDEVSNVKDSIQGNFKLVNGTDGRALKLDGFTTYYIPLTKNMKGAKIDAVVLGMKDGSDNFKPEV